MSQQINPEPTLEPSRSRRRDVLRVAGMMALGAGGVTALAACDANGLAKRGAGNGPNTGAPSAATSGHAPSASQAPSTSHAPSSAPSASRSAGGGTKTGSPKTTKVPNGIKVPTSSVPEGGGVILDNADFVVTQPSAGQYKAFTKICTHQQCPVARISGGKIICDCHGSQYSIQDGSVLQGPAPKPLAESKTVLAGNVVVITQ